MCARKKELHLFAGVAGGALGGLACGHEPIGFCEFDKDAAKVLSKWRPDLPIFPDVRTLTGDTVRAACGVPDILAGGSPCQDLSVAGKKKGFDGGERSSLIWHQVRLAVELEVSELWWENVTGALGALHLPGFNKFLKMLADAGYGGAYCVLSSAHLGANHVRPRVWLLARRSARGFVRIETGGIPLKRRYYSTPMANDAHAGRKPMPANLRRHSPPITCQVFPALKPGMDMAEVRAIVGEHRVNPDWLEASLGFPIGHTDLTCAKPRPWPGYPSAMCLKQPSGEIPRTVEVSAEADAAWAARLKQLGNSQDPQTCARAYKILSDSLNGRRTFF